MNDVPTWDFETAIGQTIRERYGEFYVRVVEISNRIHRRTMRECETHNTDWIKEGF